MKYQEIIKELKDKYVQDKISKEKLFEIYKKIYNNDNKKTFENMISLLKQYEVITDFESSYYTIVKKSFYHFEQEDEYIKIHKIISKEYEDIKIIVWNTKILNEFTQHYLMRNYMVVETEKFSIELILVLLKEKLMKKYTIVTESMYTENKKMFLNDENLLIVKALNSRAPLKRNNDGLLVPTIEKIMVDIYIDKLYEFVQGKELEYIYTNIFDNYSINIKKLYSYAKDRCNLEEYKNFIKKLKVLNER